MENISPKLVKDIENSRFRSRSRDFCQFLEGFGIGFGEFGLGKKSRFWFRKIWSQKKSLGFGFREFGLGKKVLVLVSENLVLEKSLAFGFGKFGIGKKVLVLVSENLVLEKSLAFGFGKFGIGKKSFGIGFGQNFGIVIQCS